MRRRDFLKLGALLPAVGLAWPKLKDPTPSVIINDEVIGLTRQMLRNYTIDAKTLALDVVDRVGPAGHFVSEEETLTRFREATWYPSLFDRTPRHQWEADGGRRLGEVAKERARELLRTHQPEPLDEGVDGEIEAVLKRGCSRAG